MNYNIELLDLVSDLAPIQQQLKFSKDSDGNIFLAAKHIDKKVVYCMHCPGEYFEFPGTAVRFYEYKKFKSFFDIFNNPDKDEALSEHPVLDANLNESGEVYDIIIKSSKSNQQFTYRTACEGAIEEPDFKGVDFQTIAAKYVIPSAKISHLQKMIGLIQDKMEKSGIKFHGEGNKLTVSFLCLATSNSYKIEYELAEPVAQEFTFTTDKEGILLLPTADYEINIDPRGLIKFHMVRKDEINLDLYISKQKGASMGRV